VVGDERGLVTCKDGCTYTSGEYTVERRFTSSYFSVFDAFGFSSLNILLGYSHIFTQGAQGNFIYNYEGVVTDDSSGGNTVQPALYGICTFTFNGDECVCEQYYCDAAKTRFANKIDCSSLEGGAVIDLCMFADVTNTSSLLEILYAVPRIACQDSTPTETSDPVSGPSETEEPLAMGGLTSSPAPGPDTPQNNAPTSPSNEGSTEMENAAPSVGTTADGGSPSASAPTVAVAPQSTRSLAGALSMCFSGCTLLVATFLVSTL
jgi:hypothetical protein